MAKKMNMHGNSEKEGKAWGHGQHSNMPKEVKMQAYPKSHEYGPTDLDDTMTEIDRVNSKAHTKARSNVSNQH